MTVYSNKELSQHYYRIIGQTKSPDSFYRDQRNRIAEVEFNIHQWYLEKGSLKKMKVPGIGPKTKEVLEFILENGFEQAKEIIDQRTREKSRGLFRRVPRRESLSRHDEAGPWQEKAIRDLEDG